MDSNLHFGNQTVVEQTSLPSFVYISLIVITLLVITISLAGNSLLLYTLYKVRSLRMISSYLVMNLAIVDFLVATFILPTIFITLLTKGWQLGREVCVAAGFCDAVLTKAQVMALLNIGINRYIAVHCPTFYATAKNRKISERLVLFGWLYSLVLSLPPIFGSGSYSHREQKLFCGLDRNSARLYGTINLVLGFVIPSFAGLVIYMKVLFRVFRHIRKVGFDLNDHQPSAQKVSDDKFDGEENTSRAGRKEGRLEDTKSQARIYANDEKSRKLTVMINKARKLKQDQQLNQITKVFLIIVFAFAICWIPRGVANIWALISGREAVPLSLEICSTVLIFSTCAVNPIVYGYYRTDIRQGFRTVLCCFR